MVERAPRDRRSFDILSVKKEAKLSASEANNVEVGKGDADLRQSNYSTTVDTAETGTTKKTVSAT